MMNLKIYSRGSQTFFSVTTNLLPIDHIPLIINNRTVQNVYKFILKV